MARIEAPEGGLLIERYQILMATHWLRVAIVTAGVRILDLLDAHAKRILGPVMTLPVDQIVAPWPSRACRHGKRLCILKGVRSSTTASPRQS